MSHHDRYFDTASSLCRKRKRGASIESHAGLENGESKCSVSGPSTAIIDSSSMPWTSPPVIKRSTDGSTGNFKSRFVQQSRLLHPQRVEELDTY